MSGVHNKAAVYRFIEKGFNQRDLSEFERYFSERLTDHALPPNMPPGLAGRKLFASAFFGAFPDIHVHVDDVLAEEDRVVTRWSGHGTHAGNLMGIPPTGKQVRLRGIAIDRFENGRSVEHWEIVDQMGLMQQLGVLEAD